MDKLEKIKKITKKYNELANEDLSLSSGAFLALFLYFCSIFYLYVSNGEVPSMFSFIALAAIIFPSCISLVYFLFVVFYNKINNNELVKRAGGVSNLKKILLLEYEKEFKNLNYKELVFLNQNKKEYININDMYFAQEIEIALNYEINVRISKEFDVPESRRFECLFMELMSKEIKDNERMENE
jgi:hypothetical protein